MCYLFELTMIYGPDNPSVVFYLISVFLKTNDLELVKKLVLSAEIKFSASPAVISRLEIVKQKLFLITG